MIVINNINEWGGEKLMATIGFFDGVHQGHRFLIEEMKAAGRKRGLPTAVITFPKHPRAVLQTDYHPPLLNTFEEKIARLATTGIDYCIVMDFTKELSMLSAQEYITDILHDRLHVRGLLIGYDHRFGHNRSEGFEEYFAYGAACGIEVLKASAYDKGETQVSSSRIRSLLTEGQVEEASRLLTYPYCLEGTVVEGHKLGRTIGFPTANIRPVHPAKIIPAIGVYAVRVEVEGVRYKGMLYIGNRPTAQNGTDISIEVNLLDFDGDLYTKKMVVTFYKFVRGDQTFSSLDLLKEQLALDRIQVNKILNEINFPQ